MIQVVGSLQEGTLTQIWAGEIGLGGGTCTCQERTVVQTLRGLPLWKICLVGVEGAFSDVCCLFSSLGPGQSKYQKMLEMSGETKRGALQLAVVYGNRSIKPVHNPKHQIQMNIDEIQLQMRCNGPLNEKTWRKTKPKPRASRSFPRRPARFTPPVARTTGTTVAARVLLRSFFAKSCSGSSMSLGSLRKMRKRSPGLRVVLFSFLCIGCPMNGPSKRLTFNGPDFAFCFFLGCAKDGVKG